jgi:hypothetical protein
MVILLNKHKFRGSAEKWYIDNTANTVYLWAPKADSLFKCKERDTSIENGIINLIISYHSDSEFKSLFENYF